MNSGQGVFPDADPWGQKFSKVYHKERFEKAGKPLPVRGCLAGVQADQEYLKKLFNLKRHLTELASCLQCL